MEVRVRYAPSPTGLQHIGGIRTALFNYFFAKSSGGKFLLRIEDTDQTRYNADAEQDLYDTLDWLGIKPDESPRDGGAFGPYVQSQRSALYQEYAQKLVDDGKAYKCYCTSERLDRIRKLQEANKMPPGYDRHCAHLSAEERAEAEKSGVQPVIRLAIPLEGETTFDDYLLGRITWPNKDISPDPILLKSDGLPTYHLANIVDDHFMQISHVLRAQEWLPSGPFHVRLYEAFGWKPPIFCHLPMVMGTDGQKLSKRHGATAVKQFREGGYLPEAIINYITLLGWSFDPKTELLSEEVKKNEILSKEDLEKVFSIERLKKSPAIFDYKKLDHFNSEYIRRLSPEFFAEYVFQELEQAGYTNVDKDKVMQALPLIQDRVKNLKEIPVLLRFILDPISSWDMSELVSKKLDNARAIDALKELLVIIPGFTKRATEENEASIKAKAEEMGLPFAVLMVLLRVASLGSKASPPLFDSMKLVGEEEVLVRLAGAITFIQKSGV